MTEAKKLKKAIRARSHKTGESYTSARRQLLAAQKPRGARGDLARNVPPPPKRPAAAKAGEGSSNRPAIGEAAIAKKTGHGYAHWFEVLDAFEANTRGHAASAGHLHEVHGVPGWHSQMITVAYERARGLRAVNQSCAGDFQVSVTRTVPAPVSEVAKAFEDARRRAAWLAAADPELAGALEKALAGSSTRIKLRDPGNARLRYPWKETSVEIRIAATARGGASVTADNTKLQSAAAVAERRALWRAGLESLKTQFTG